MNSISRDYYKDNCFNRDEGGDISLWRHYKLFASDNRASYIDSFLERAVDATSFTHQLVQALEHKNGNWFLG
jgi:hypothetical protein